MRLDKFLSDMNVGSRKELKQLIKAKRVTIEGEIVRDPAFQVTEKSLVAVDDHPISYNLYEYYMLNKPSGVITATEDRRQRTVLDLMDGDQRKDIFPVGRLDKDTVGLLLLTNDGEMNHRLLSPKKHVDKEYYAKVSGKVTEKDVESFAKGLFLDEGFRCLPAKLSVLCVREANAEDEIHLQESLGPVETLSDGVSEIKVVIQEGKFHQIKKMFHQVGKEVFYLKRISMGPLVLDESLKEGEVRPLTEEELAALKEVTSL